MTNLPPGHARNDDIEEDVFLDGHLAAFGLFSFAERLLSPHEEEEARTHLDGCALCRQALSAEQSLTVSLRQVELSPPVDVAESVRATLVGRRREARSYRLWWAAAIALLVASGVQWVVGSSPAGMVTAVVRALLLVPESLASLAESATDGTLLSAIADFLQEFATVVGASPAALVAVTASFLLVAAAMNLTILYGARRLLVEVRR